MFSVRSKGWIYMRGEDKADKGRKTWILRFCVVFEEERIFKIFLDEQEYLNDPAFQENNNDIKPKQAWKSRMGESESPELVRRGRSQSLITPSVHQKLAEFPRRLANGIRSHTRSNSVSVQTIDTAEFIMKYQALNPDHLHISRSQETLDQSRRRSSTVQSMDLSISGRVSVRPIHPSILHKQFCFQVMSPHEIKYFSCRSADELNKWINSIKKSIQPTRDQQHRIDVGMSVWVVEAKGLSTKSKKRYYCEILLDKDLYARTTTKTKADSLFWGENFNFEDLPDFSKLTVNLYKDSDSKNKKDKRKVIGSVDVMVENLDNNQEVEKWYPVTIATNKGTNGEAPSIRLKIKYQRISILPLKAYNELLSYIKNNYILLCETLESAVSSKVKDEIAGIILRVLQPIGKAQEFLVDIVMNEVTKLADENLVFRGNSFATKAMDTYMKMVGDSYLQETLGNLIASVYGTNQDCEVDPSKLTVNIDSNRQNLKAFVEKTWINILNSSSFFPRDLQETFHEFQKRCADRNKDLSNNLISSSIFLRFLCPAILSPSLFHLVQEYPNEKTSRTLTLIAKVIQNLANFTRFGGKEEYMEFMNEFVENEFEQMKQFLDKISAQPNARENHYDGSIDLGKELTVLYHTLKEQMSKLNQDLQDHLRPLQFVLKSLQESYNDVDRTTTDNTDSVPPKKWASSSDLISDQTKENITLTPVNQMQPTKAQEDPFTASRPGSGNESRVSPRRMPRLLPTPQHLIVSPEEIIVSSPCDFGNRRYSSPNTRSFYENDLSSTASSVSLRRHSYLNAIGTDDEDEPTRRSTETSAAIEKKIRKAQLGHPSQIKQGNGTHLNGYNTLPTGETKGKRDLSKSFTETNTKSKKKSPRDRPWSLVLDYQSSPKEARPSTPPVIMDRSRTLLVADSPRTQQKASPLAIIDSITRSHTERDSDQSSPSSSPLPQRRTPQHSPRLLRARSEKTPELKQVARTPSATSSSSSESSGSWRSSSFGSSGTADKVRRRHILPSTPNMDGPRRESRSTTGSREDDGKDDSLFSQNAVIHEEQDKSDLLKELEETKRALASTQEQLVLQESSTHKLVASFKERLAETEENSEKAREDKNKEIKELLDRLVSVENELEKEREEMQKVVQAKQRIIDAQEKRIKSLESTNSRLVATLNQLKSKQDKDRSKQMDKKEQKVSIEEQKDEYV